MPREEIVDVEACYKKQKEIMYVSTGIDTDLCGKCFAVCAYTQRYLRSGYHSRSEFHRNAIFLENLKKPLTNLPTYDII